MEGDKIERKVDLSELMQREVELKPYLQSIEVALEKQLIDVQEYSNSAKYETAVIPKLLSYGFKMEDIQGLEGAPLLILQLHAKNPTEPSYILYMMVDKSGHAVSLMKTETKGAHTPTILATGSVTPIQDASSEQPVFTVKDEQVLPNGEAVAEESQTGIQSTNKEIQPQVRGKGEVVIGIPLGDLPWKAAFSGSGEVTLTNLVKDAIPVLENVDMVTVGVSLEELDPDNTGKLLHTLRAQLQVLQQQGITIPDGTLKLLAEKEVPAKDIILKPKVSVSGQEKKKTDEMTYTLSLSPTLTLPQGKGDVRPDAVATEMRMAHTQLDDPSGPATDVQVQGNVEIRRKQPVQGQILPSDEMELAAQANVDVTPKDGADFHMQVQYGQPQSGTPEQVNGLSTTQPTEFQLKSLETTAKPDVLGDIMPSVPQKDEEKTLNINSHLGLPLPAEVYAPFLTLPAGYEMRLDTNGQLNVNPANMDPKLISGDILLSIRQQLAKSGPQLEQAVKSYTMNIKLGVEQRLPDPQQQMQILSVDAKRTAQEKGIAVSPSINFVIPVEEGEGQSREIHLNMNGTVSNIDDVKNDPALKNLLIEVGSEAKDPLGSINTSLTTNVAFDKELLKNFSPQMRVTVNRMESLGFTMGISANGVIVQGPEYTPESGAVALEFSRQLIQNKEDGDTIVSLQTGLRMGEGEAPTDQGLGVGDKTIMPAPSGNGFTTKAALSLDTMLPAGPNALASAPGSLQDKPLIVGNKVTFQFGNKMSLAVPLDVGVDPKTGSLVSGATGFEITQKTIDDCMYTMKTTLSHSPEITAMQVDLRAASPQGVAFTASLQNSMGQQPGNKTTMSVGYETTGEAGAQSNFTVSGVLNDGKFENVMVRVAGKNTEGVNVGLVGGTIFDQKNSKQYYGLGVEAGFKFTSFDDILQMIQKLFTPAPNPEGAMPVSVPPAQTLGTADGGV